MVSSFYFRKFDLDSKMEKVCGTCQFAHMELDNHDDFTSECRKLLPSIINRGRSAKFPKILPKWYCNEHLEVEKNYWDLLP